MYKQLENMNWPLFQTTNLIKIRKPKNVDLKGNPQRIYPTLHLFIELRYYAVNTADKIVDPTFPSDQTFSRLKLKLNRHLNVTT